MEETGRGRRRSCTFDLIEQAAASSVVRLLMSDCCAVSRAVLASCKQAVGCSKNSWTVS